MAERGVILTYEAVRYWCRKFGQAYANQFRRRRPRPGDKWHLDEVFLTINGRTALSLARRRPGRPYPRYPGAAPAGQEGCEEILPQAAQGLDVRAAGDHHGSAQELWAALREILPSVEHRQHRYLNNRAENSHQPTRQRERRMQRFKSPGHAQRFLAAYGPIAPHFRPRRHRLSAPEYRQEMASTIPGLAGSHGVGSCRISVNQGAAVYLQAWSWH